MVTKIKCILLLLLFKYYGLCDGKTDHPMKTLLKTLSNGRRNLAPLDGYPLLTNLLSKEQLAAMNEMAKSKSEMKDNIEDSKKFLEANPKFKEELAKAKNLDEMLANIDKLSLDPKNFQNLLANSADLEKMKISLMQIQLMTYLAKLRVDTDCKEFIDP